MKQKEARVLREIINEMFDEWTNTQMENDEYSNRWWMPLNFTVSMRKTMCIYCNQYIECGDLRTQYNSHVSCLLRMHNNSLALLELAKVRVRERGLDFAGENNEQAGRENN